ncbi:LysR family transcriptional regulator [Amycolatopsis sp. NBC_00345]|uniref:LysR family transcriptional regulator n=1 Tax=Amycolatopsis sp. NBC_00345 TaxID=2975955 RepID=UPI002E2755ED
MDLNLLVALDALLEENSVAAAADRLRLSAPAMSRTLARIRRATGDDILVRTGRTMSPTPRALELRDEAHELVRRAAAVLTPARELDLDGLERVFTVRGHDALVDALAPLLVGAIAAVAPRAGLRLLAETSADSTDLARGHVDLEVGATRPERPEIAAETIGSDRVVAVVRRGHPLAGGDLTPERFAAAVHVSVSRRGRRHGAIDEALTGLGLSRRVIASLPTSAAALDLAAGSDVVAVVAERVCRPLWTKRDLVVRVLPFTLPAVPVVLAWHHRHDSDPAHAWLRDEVRRALETVVAPDGGLTP